MIFIFTKSFKYVIIYLIQGDILLIEANPGISSNLF